MVVHSREQDLIPTPADAGQAEENALKDFIPLVAIDAEEEEEEEEEGKGEGKGKGKAEEGKDEVDDVSRLSGGNIDAEDAAFQGRGASSELLLEASIREVKANDDKTKESHGKVEENDANIIANNEKRKVNHDKLLQSQRHSDKYDANSTVYEKISISKRETIDRADDEICQDMEVTSTSYEVKEDDDRALELQRMNDTCDANNTYYETILVPNQSELVDSVTDDCCNVSIVENGGFLNGNSEDEQILQDDIIGSGSEQVVDDVGTTDGRLNLKRSRSSSFSNTPSVQVVYSCLTSESKDKLKELLRQWAEWHSTCVRSAEEINKDSLESGNEMYFPALQVGGERKTAVPFWMDKPSKHARIDVAADTTDITQRDVPLYDRAGLGVLISEEAESYIEGNLEHIGEGSRCFNCGSYSHAIRDCPRPRDYAAINNARKLMAEKRGSATGPRTASRYYQLSPGGKFEDLKPGVIGGETRQLLGIGELDPPPWLNRMRELGYPPGYLEDQDEEPSGITIFGTDEDGANGICIGEDGEIIGEQKKRSSRKKMVVHFPGLNAPIPHDADKRIWGSSADGSGRHQGYINDDLDSATRDSDRRSSRAHSPSRDRTSTRKSSMRTHSPSRDRSSSRQPSPHLSRTSSDSARSPKASYDESYSLPPLAGSYPISRHSPMHSMRPYHSPSTPSQRSQYGQDCGHDAFEFGRRAWAKAQDTFRSSSNHGKRSPSRRR